MHVDAQDFCKMSLKHYSACTHMRVLERVHVQIAKPREMGNLSSVRKVVGLTSVGLETTAEIKASHTQKKGGALRLHPVRLYG